MQSTFRMKPEKQSAQFAAIEKSLPSVYREYVSRVSEIERDILIVE